MDVASLRKGDRKAFQYLIDTTHRDVYRLAFKFTSNADDARDISQEVYLEAFRNIHGFREDANIKTWLYRITVNRSLNLIKKNKSKFMSVSIDDSETSAFQISAPSTHEADSVVENKELKKILQTALNTLPENQRIAFLLFNHDGMSYAEIAEVMSLSLSSVESLIFRSKANLRKELADFYQNNYGHAQVLKNSAVK